MLALSNKPHLPVTFSYKTQLLAFIIFITVSNYIQLICGLLINACLFPWIFLLLTAMYPALGMELGLSKHFKNIFVE